MGEARVSNVYVYFDGLRYKIHKYICIKIYDKGKRL